MAMSSSTANWHWKNKNATPWAKTWFEQELVGLSVSGKSESEKVSITQVKEVDGDVELGQRKSKLITIFDCKVVLAWEGTTSDGSEVKGTLTVPEVSHEVTVDKLSDYVYSWSCATSSNPGVDAAFALAKKQLPPILEAKFNEFPAALIATHGKDLTVASNTSSGTSTPKTTATAPVVAAATATTSAAVSAQKKNVNTSRVVVEATFMASADDLFSLLTDEKRIPAWTRNTAQSTPQPGGSYSFFGGGVKGTYESLTPGKEIKQKWALQSPTWPSGHEATLTITLDQSTDSTKTTFTLEGVPKGSEAEINRNLEGYYVQGLKSIGYVQLYPSPIPSQRPSTPKRAGKKRTSPEAKESAWQTIGLMSFFAGLVLLGTLSIPYLSKLEQ